MPIIITNDLCPTIHDKQAWATIAASQADTIQTIQSAIPYLRGKPDASWGAADDVSLTGSRISLEAFDAPGPANVAWMSALSVEGIMNSLTIFNGPLTDVPHFISR